MKPALAALFALLTAAAGGVSAAPESAPPGPPVLAGHTLNAFAYVAAPPGSHHGGLDRLMLQAYLGPGGRALVRVWDGTRGVYTAVAERPWSIEGSTLCVGLPAGGPPKLCADVHVWGPRIAGTGIQPYVQLDGDLQLVDTIGGRR
jgi:hypothetical protein